MLFYRPTWAEVDLDNLVYNFRVVKRLVPAHTKVMVTVKADAYGHGLIPVSRKLASLGADYLGVACIDEGIRLRGAGIKLPILVLGLILKDDAELVLKYGLTATICDMECAFALDKKAKALKKVARVHIKVDTGMGRIGVLQDAAEAFVKKVNKLGSVRIEGIFTHFPMADSNENFTFCQIELFNRLVRKLKEAGISIPLVHAANSIGTIGYKNSHFNLVRPGLMVYGLYPKDDLKIKLKPVLSLKTRVIFAKKLPAGYGVSYGHTYVTKKPTRILTLPIGYGDGYPRSLSNLAPVLIKGKRLKVVGRICMDQMMVDAGGLPVKAGDEVVLIGVQGRNKVTAEELAALSQTIPYEIVCGLGSRIPRVYL